MLEATRSGTSSRSAADRSAHAVICPLSEVRGVALSQMRSSIESGHIPLAVATVHRWSWKSFFDLQLSAAILRNASEATSHRPQLFEPANWFQNKLPGGAAGGEPQG